MANTKLNRTAGSTGNRRTWTWSGWVKRCHDSTGTDPKGGLFATYTDGNNRLDFGIDANDKFFFKEKQSSTNIDFTTTAVFRDLSAWYHFVVAVDTTQATQSNRVKIYVNGSQITAWVDNTYPSQNYDTLMNVSGRTYLIGTTDGSSNYWNGLMSHVHLADGTQYAASTFGSTNANGEWEINTSPTFTPGTNGFTVLKDGSTITDQSANSNNFTLGGGTLTNTEDCPSNNFATGNASYFTNAAWTTDLSNGNNTFTGHTGSNSYPMVASTLAATGGKFYAEFKVTSSSQNYYVGVATPEAVSGTAINAHYPNWDNEGGTQAHAYSYYGADGQKYVKTSGGATSASAYGSSSSQNDILGVALDLDNNNLYIHKNGTYFNSGVPTSGSTGTGAISVVAHDYLLFMSDGGGGSDASGTANFGNGFFATTAISSEGTNASGVGKFEYDVPAGYTALSTKGLNL